MTTRAAAAAKAGSLRFCKLRPEPAADSRIGLSARAAFLTDAPYQALGDDALQGGRDHIGLEPQIKYSGNRGHGRIGVQSGIHEVAGERGLKRDLGSGGSANLAEQYHVRILAQDGP